MKSLVRISVSTLFWVALALSVAGNIWSCRREIRDYALLWLKPDQPIVRVEPGNRILAGEVAKLREQIERERHEDRSDVAALREHMDNVIAKQSTDVRDDLERLKEQVKELDTGYKGFRHGVAVIRGELIRKGHLPKEYSTAF